ncbi:MAG: RNA polymerase sigma factor [Pseudomarimonas sp.]
MDPTPSMLDIEAAREGDALALSRLLGNERRRVVRYAERHCKVHDVEDAVQETLLIASRQISGLRVVEAFNGWLFRIVKRECDRMKLFYRTHIFDYSPDASMPEPVLVVNEGLRIDLVAAVESLPAHYREVLLLRDVQELTVDEMAARLRLSREAVKGRLHRARLLVREYLDT